MRRIDKALLQIVHLDSAIKPGPLGQVSKPFVVICIHRNRNRDRNRIARIHKMRNLACLPRLLLPNLEASGKHSTLGFQVPTLFDFDFDPDFDSDFDLDYHNNVYQFIPFKKLLKAWPSGSSK
jgi:hypothetical protein